MPTKRRTFDQSMRLGSSLLERHDKKHSTFEKALKHFDPTLHPFHNIMHLMTKSNSRARIGAHYKIIHAVLDQVSHGNIKSKRILHVGASTGVYAKFLQDTYRADVTAMDTDRVSIREARDRGVKKVVRRSAIPEEIHERDVLLPKGVWRKRTRAKLPFLDNSFDFIISEHFLFSNFHKGYDEPGFEREPGSIEESMEALKEYNRILTTGGRVVIDGAHHDEIQLLRAFKKGKRMYGFIVEKIFDKESDPYLQTLGPQPKFPNKMGPRTFVLRKLEPWPPQSERIK